MSDDQSPPPETSSQDRAGPSAGQEESPGYVSDDQLPEDLVAGIDNPLAEAADEGESAIDPDIEPGGDHAKPVEKRPDDDR